MIKVQRPVIILVVILATIITFSCLYAITVDDNGSPYITASLKGEQIKMYGGNGLYAYNPVENAIMMRAFDWYFLLIAIPVMIAGLLLYLKKSIIGFFILLSSLFFCIYNYIINSIAFAYNDLFLIYMAIFMTGIFAAIFCISGVNSESFKKEVLPRLPVKLITISNFVFAAYFLISWLIIDFSTLLNGSVHPDLSIYTTAGINITDLCIFVPLAVASGVMLLKGKTLGAILSIGILLLVFQEMIALNLYSFMKVAYLNEGLDQIEYPLMIIAFMSFILGLLAIRKLKGIKVVFSKELKLPV